jgi:outer membrane lipoprotein-sorting protein
MKRYLGMFCLTMLIATAGVPLYADSLTAYDYLHAIQARYDLIEDYQCRMHEFSIGGGRREEKIINYYFKKPKLIRLDILDGNRAFDKGSVGVYTGGEKVTGHRGGIMREIVLSIKKDSALATSVRGETIDQSDMLTIIERIEYLLVNGDASIVEKVSHIEFEFFPHDPSKNEGISKDVVWVDRETMLIIRNERYEEERLVQQVTWGKHIINAGLPKELFDAHFETDQLKDTGIQLIDHDLDGDSVTP